MLQILAIASGVLIIISYMPYLRDIFRGKTKPERVSWFIWATLGAIAVFTQLAEGGWYSLALPATETLFTLLIFILALKYGMGGTTKRDIVGLCAAILGLVIWYFTKQPLIALLITVLVDLSGAILTVLKAYEEPESETLISWILVAIAGLLATLAVGELKFGLLIYPIYICLANAATAVAILLGRTKAKNENYINGSTG